MPVATLNQSGELSLPPEIRERLGLKAGDVVHLRLVDDHTLEVKSRYTDPMALAGILKSDVRGVTLEDMARAVEEGSTGR